MNSFQYRFFHSVEGIEKSSPEIMKCPLGSDTPLNPHLPDGKLATVCQEDPPSFFRISVETMAIFVAWPGYPPETI